MGATRKDIDKVYYWIKNIGRELRVPFPKTAEAREEMELELYPKMVGEGSHCDFEIEMREYLQGENPYGSIRFRFEEISDFQQSVRSHFIDWTILNHSIGTLPRMSYFIMRKNIDEIQITKENGKLCFNIKDNRDRYPTKVKLSQKQLFLLKPFLSAHSLSEDLIHGPTAAL